MTWLHPDITTLYRLEYLNLSENDLIYLPNDLNKLTSLKGKCYFIAVQTNEPTHLSLDILKNDFGDSNAYKFLFVNEGCRKK